MNNEKKAISYVSKALPCEHCGKADWCYRFANKASVCNRGSIGIDFEDSGKKDKAGKAILYPKAWGQEPPKPQVISTQEWLYYDRTGQELVKVIRQNLDNGKKKIFQNFKVTNGWIKTKPKGLERSDIPIYKYADIQAAIEREETIFIVEGEKIADLFWSLGLAATTNIQGANNYSDSDAKAFFDTESPTHYHPHIVLVPDRDTPGIKLMQQWEKGLNGKVEWLYPYFEKDWKKIPPSDGLDAYDWITDNGLKKEEIEAAIAVIPESLKTIEVKTSTPLKNPTTYTDDPNAEQPAEDQGVVETKKGNRPLDSVELLSLVEGLGDRLKFDDLTSTLILDEERLSIGKDIKFWFLKTFGESARKDDIADCLTYVAKQNAFNPLKEYLLNLDCEPISINNLAKRYLGKDEPIYSRMMEMWLVSAVARALTPLEGKKEGKRLIKGSKVDYTLILQSGQGKYKSSFFEVLGGEWFSDSVKDIESKDSLMIVHSSWIIELSELDRITSKKQAGTLKHWLTQKCDSYRKPYAPEVEQNLPRRCVFCGTVNPTKFLVDDENRRFWIIPIPEYISIDVNLLETERDQIWKAALLAYQQGAVWWPTDEETKQIADLNVEFRQIDAWEEEVDHFIRKREYVATYEILTELFKFEPANIKDADSKRLSKILDNLGWKKAARKEYLTEFGEIKIRNVRLNPFINNNLDSKGGNGGKSPSIQDFREIENGGISQYGGNAPTASTGLPPKVETLLNSPQENSTSNSSPPTIEYLFQIINGWAITLGWTKLKLQAFAQSRFGPLSAKEMNEAQLGVLIEMLEKHYYETQKVIDLAPF